MCFYSVQTAFSRLVTSSDTFCLHSYLVQTANQDQHIVSWSGPWHWSGHGTANLPTARTVPQDRFQNEWLEASFQDQWHKCSATSTYLVQIAFQLSDIVSWTGPWPWPGHGPPTVHQDQFSRLVTKWHFCKPHLLTASYIYFLLYCRLLSTPTQVPIATGK